MPVYKIITPDGLGCVTEVNVKNARDAEIAFMKSDVRRQCAKYSYNGSIGDQKSYMVVDITGLENLSNLELTMKVENNTLEAYLFKVEYK
ncbi:hypothetical protein [Sodalis sp. RH19]|uniref:hypothetical protein n=1 Tax=Sodalis sp. RH19 TaxID=3394334 RepID=UPI0039B63BA1